MHQLVKLPDAIWLLQLVISFPFIHALGYPSQTQPGFKPGCPVRELDDLPTELSLLKCVKPHKSSWCLFISELDEEECERRRSECMDDMGDLERQFTEIKDQYVVVYNILSCCWYDFVSSTQIIWFAYDSPYQVFKSYCRCTSCKS